MGDNSGGRLPGRRGGPVPVGEPTDQDRETVAQLQRQSQEARERELEAQAAAAEPAGEPPADAQRQEIIRIEQRSAERRGAAARAIRRQPVPVGVVYDDERDQVAQLQGESADRRTAELADMGVDDPALDEGNAGFPAELPHLPGSDLFGVFDCPNCGAQVERPFPGYVDWDAASRDLVCRECGTRVVHGQAPEPQATSTSSSEPADVVQTSAQAGQGGPAPLTDAERIELDELRADKAAREAGETRRPGDWREPPLAQSTPSTPPPPAEAPPETTEQPPAG